jgi:hypothetical protein
MVILGRAEEIIGATAVVRRQLAPPGPPVPGQEIGEPGSRMIVDPAEQVGEPGLRIEAVEPWPFRSG